MNYDSVWSKGWREWITVKIVKLGNDFLNIWYLNWNGKRILVDTGYDTDWELFCEHLAQEGDRPEDIDWLFLTHAHDDHAGFVNELLNQSQAKAVASEKALVGLRRGQNGPGGGAPDQDAIDLCMKMVQEGRGAHRFPKLLPEHEARFLWVNDGTRAEIEAQLGMRIVDLPGHTEDSIALLTPGGELFVGDAAQNGAYCNDHTTIWIGDLEDYICSWERMLETKAKRIYPGHGEPFPAEELREALPVLRTKELKVPGRKK